MIFFLIYCKELQEEYARVLTMNDTRVPDSLVEWSWNKMEFVKLPKPKNIVNILSVPGTLLHRDSEEAKKQMAGHCLGNNINNWIYFKINYTVFIMNSC